LTNISYYVRIKREKEKKESMNTIENNICQAIDIIVQKAISEAEYDKTIQATIVSCVDATIGKYKMKYQDSTFYAYSGSSEITYTEDSIVYVLIPGNNMSKDKTILGAVKKLGINYVTTTEGDEAYEVVGKNCLSSSESFGLSSYREGTYAKILYHKDYSDEQNLITLNKTAVNEYIKNSSTIICGAKIRTSLSGEQQYRGNYGIIFALDFIDNTNNEIVTRYYTIDVDKMTGNPYKLIYETRQYGIFEIDNSNFKEVNYISIFTNDFPTNKPEEECIDDIFIKDIELCGAERLSDDDISNYSLSFVTPQGTYFDNNSLDSDICTLQAQVRVKGKVIDNDSQSLPYYWFIEHAGITSQSQYYNKYGGQGWKCLNNFNVIQKETDSDPTVVEWVPASYEWKIKKSDIGAKEVKYKCAVVYDGTVITKTIIIKNLSSEYDIIIESDGGTQFYFDIGLPTLTCLVSGEKNSNYTYSWGVTDNTGTFQSLESNSNQIKINVNTITNFSTYQCTVYNKQLYIGTASIVLTNSLEAEGVYNLVINDGTYVYKYNENGISPASQAQDSPIEIKALTFNIYDNLGNKIDDGITRHCDIKWIVPSENTLIEIPSSYQASAVDLINGTKTYSNIMSLSYKIADRYNITKTKNNIQLIVKYKGMNLVAKTDFTFVKEGESGTNGTEFICRIVPNVASGEVAPLYPTITQLSGGTWSINYTPVNSNRFFRAQLWHNENKILDSVTSTNSTEGKSASITWSILKNKYTSSVSDTSALTVNAATGVFGFSSFTSEHPAHIVKVIIVYDDVTYYATMPLITVKLTNNNYKVNLKENTGFRYAVYTSDGQSPKYDNNNPFELTITQNNTNVSTGVSYTWSYLGRLYEGGNWINSINIGDRVLSGLASNQKAVKPLDSFDGQCVTNALLCVISKDNTEIARIHIPIHLLLNRYGNSAINGWDGNSINIDANGGFILAPQVGAGIKETDNSFTGVVMGKVKESGQSKEDIGLIGYSKGTRSIFLDAETGKATFGANGKGQIIIDPSNNKAQLYSGNYSTSNKTGMMIDLTTPEIKFGSGTFSVDKDGKIKSTSGTIGGWTITENSLYTGSKQTFDNTTNGIFLGSGGTVNIGNSSKYLKYSNGTLSIKGTVNADEGYIGGWTIKDGNLEGSDTSKIVAGTIEGSTISGGSISGTTISGGKNIPFYAGKGEVQIGDFYVSDDYGRHIFQSDDECTGMSTGDIGDREWFFWAGYGYGSGSADTVFIVGPGQVRIEGTLFLNDRNILDIIKEYAETYGGGGDDDKEEEDF
jgi:hypothetical protein